MKWTPEEETLLINSIGELSYLEIAKKIEEKYDARLPGFPCIRTIPYKKKSIKR